jgi:hypothetical protein
LEVCECLGVHMSQSKRKYFASWQRYLGNMTETSRLRTDDAVILAPKPGMREKAAATAARACTEGTLRPADASSMRGVFNWLDTALLGRPCRGALSALQARQIWEYCDGAYTVTGNLRLALQHLVRSALTVAERPLPICALPLRPVIIYSDASAKGKFGDIVKLGFCIFKDGTCHVGSHDVPAHIMERFCMRKHYINVGELLVAPLIAVSCRELLENRDVVWFIDNRAALSALIKGAAPQVDTAFLALTATWAFSSANSRVWFDRVDSDGNPSDLLSRDGIESALIKEAIAYGNVLLVEAQPNWDTLVPADISSMSSVFESMPAVGGVTLPAVGERSSYVTRRHKGDSRVTHSPMK